MDFLGLFKTSEQASTPFLDAVQEDTFSKDTLAPDVQGYVSEIGAVLGYNGSSFRTMKDWEALEKSESDRLLMEEERGLMQSAIVDGIAGKGTDEVSKRAENLVRTIKLPDIRIPQAASISAARQEIAVSDVENPEKSEYTPEFLKHQQTLYENRAILKGMKAAAQEKVHQASVGTWVKDTFWSQAPGVEAATAKEAFNAIGLVAPDVIKESFGDTLSEMLKRVNAAEYYELFSAFMNHVADTRSTGEMLQIIKEIDRIWEEKGINPYVQERMWSNAVRVEPGLPTFNAAALGLSAAYTAEHLARAGKAVSTGMYRVASKEALKAGGEALSLPFVDTAVETTFKGVNRLAKLPGSTDELTKIIKKAVETGDRKLIVEAIQTYIGKPTDDKLIFKAENKEGIINYLIDDILQPTSSPEKSFANDAEAIAGKIMNSYREKLQAIVKEVLPFDSLKRDVMEYAWKVVNDSLDITSLPGIGRGTYGEKIVGFSDIVQTKEGSQVFLLRLADDQKPRSALLSRIENGKNLGFQEAERIGKQMTEALQVTNKELKEPFGIAYRTELRNGYYIPTIEIDTRKGFGVINYDMLYKEGKIKQEHWRPFMSSVFTASSNPTDIQMAEQLRSVAASIIKSTGVSAEEMFKALPKNEKAVVQALFDISTMYGAWYPVEHLLLRGVSPEAVEVYMAGKLVNDFSYFVMNKAERASLIARGGKKVYFNNKELEGVVRPIRDYHSPSELKDKLEGKKVLVDATDGVPHALTDENLIKDYYSKGYILIEPSISPDATVSARSYYYLLNPQSTNINDLGAFVMTYVPGGRRFFDRRSAFLKQLVMRDKENGGLSIIGVQTFFADLDEAGMIRRAAILNDIRDAIIDGDIEKANTLIGSMSISKAPFKDAKTFREYFEEMGMDFIHKENRLEVITNGQIKNGLTLESYNNFVKKTGVEDLVGMENMKNFMKNSHFQAITNEAKVQRAKRTGRELLTWDFDVAQPVDFEMQMRYLVQDMIQQDVMDIYTDIYAERFAKEFKDVIRERRPDGVSFTPREILFDAPILEGLTGEKAKKALQAETARANYRFYRGIPSELDKKVANTGRAFIEWIGGNLEKFVPESFENAAHGVRVNWAKFQNLPLLHYQRALAAHWYLGCFNVSQFWKQAFQDVSIALLDKSAPLFAGDAMRLMPVMLRSNGSKIEAIKLAKEAFKDDPKMLANALNVIDMGFFEHGAAGGFLERGQTVASSASRLSFMPFNWGEMHPRVLSALTALNKEGLYGIRANPTKLRSPTLYAKALYMNMDATGMSRMQNSQIAQTLLQFMNPRMRWLETALFDKNLTPLQRSRLFAGTLLLTGSQGLLGIEASSWVSNNLYRLFHNENEEELPAVRDRQDIWVNIARYATEGIPNKLSRDAGLNVNFVSPLELGLGDFVDVAMNAADLDIVSTQVLAKFGKALTLPFVTAYDFVTTETTPKIYEQTLEKLLQNMPTSFRPVLAYNMYRTGEMLNAKGELVDRVNSKLQAFLLGIGFESLSYKDMMKYYTDYNDHSTYMKALEDEAYQYYADWIRYGQPKDRMAYESLLQTANLQPHDKATVIKNVTGRARELFGPSKVEKATLEQFVRGGTYGTNLLQIRGDKE